MNLKVICEASWANNTIKIFQFFQCPGIKVESKQQQSQYEVRMKKCEEIWSKYD